MLIDLKNYKFIFVIINLLVLYFVMRKLLFAPVTSFMEKRTKGIKDALENADRVKIETEEIKKKYANQLKLAKDEADKIIANAHLKGAKEHDKIVAQAKENAESILLKAREEIERERDQMIKEIKNQVVSLALSAASKVIEANMDNERNKEIVNKFIDEEGAA